MPGRINAMAAVAAAAAPAAPAPAATTSYSGNSGESEAAPSSASPSPSPDGRPARALPAARAGLYTPSGRTQQLLRLLELNEQLAGAGGSSSAAAAEGGAASSGSTPVPPFPWQQLQQQRVQPAAATPQMLRVPSATAALDTLALLAEAEAESDAAGSAPEASPGGARAPLVSAF